MKAQYIKRKILNAIWYIKKYGVRYTLRVIKVKLKGRKSRRQLSLGQLPVIEEKVKFSILIPLYNTEIKYLKELVDSIRSQSYHNWELCLADGSNQNISEIEEVCLQYQKDDERIKYHKLTKNQGISENTNECAKYATGDYIVLSDHDDVLNSNALYMNALAIQETDADVLYSDEDHISLDGKHVNPFYKPDFSLDLLYSQMYICHLFVFKKELFEQVGGFRKQFDGSQDYDLMLRFTEITKKICHIPQILYSWREIETSTAINPDAKPYAHDAGLNALKEHLARTYGEQANATESEYTFVYDARFHIPKDSVKVSIIIPMKDQHELSHQCVTSILEKSSYSNYEVLLLNNNSEKQETKEWFEKIKQADSRIKILDADFAFNWSKLNNFGIQHATGEVYIFLNNDTVVISHDWIERLAEQAIREDIGVVGPLLLYKDDTIQHAGVVVGMGGWADHVFKGMGCVHYGTPFASSMVSRNVLAVTGACMAVSKKTIEQIGLFDEQFIICGSDIELCVRAYENGLRNLYDARVRLYHLESKTRDKYIPESDFTNSEKCYSTYKKEGDPFYNLNLDIQSVWPKESECLRYGYEELKENFKKQSSNW